MTKVGRYLTRLNLYDQPNWALLVWKTESFSVRDSICRTTSCWKLNLFVRGPYQATFELIEHQSLAPKKTRHPMHSILNVLEKVSKFSMLSSSLTTAFIVSTNSNCL